MLSQSQIAKLLGRPLTTLEKDNFSTYLDIALSEASTMLCFDLKDRAPGARTYDTRNGYRTVFIDPFTNITSVTIDEATITTFIKKQNDSYRGDWFNSLEFDDKLNGDRITVTASWGFDSLPTDLSALIAGLFGVASQDMLDRTVKSKRIEDFQVQYSEESFRDMVVGKHVATIMKYSQCEKAIEHGL